MLRKSHRNRSKNTRGLTDRDLGKRCAPSHFCEPLEPRTLLAAVNWTGLGDGVNWTNAANWSSDPSLPGPADDVTISVAANPTITLNIGTQTINSLMSDENLTLSGGTLSVAVASAINGSYTLSGGTLAGAGPLTLNNAANSWTSGTMSGTGTTVVAPGATLTATAGVGVFLTSTRPVNNNGAVVAQGGVELRLHGGGTHSGAFSGPNDTLISFAGTHVLSASSSFSSLNFIQRGSVTVEGTVTTLAAFFVRGGTGNYNVPFSPFRFDQNTGVANFNAASVVGGGASILSGGTLGGSGDVSFTNTLSWTGGTMTGSGTTIIASGGTLNINGGGTKQLNRTLQNDATVEWTAGDLQMSGGTVNNGGSFAANSDSTLHCQGIGGVNTFNNSGTFTKEGLGTTHFILDSNPVKFNNTGTVVVQGGQLSFGGGGTHTGDFTVASGTVLLLSGGTHTLSAASDITGAGSLRVVTAHATIPTVTHAGTVNIGGTAIFQNGTATFNGASFAAGAVTFTGGTANFSTATPASIGNGDSTFSSGTLGGSSDVTVTGTLSWTGGTMSGTGKTVIASGAAANVTTTATKTLARTLENFGTLELNTTPSASLTMSNGTVTNTANGVFILSGGTGFASGGGTNAFNNAGTFNKASTGTATIAVSFNNTATVNVDAGTLSLDAGGTNSNLFDVDSGTVLRFNTSYTHAVGSLLMGTGAVNFSTTGTHTFPAGTFMPTGLVNFNAGTVTINNTFTPSSLGTIAGTVNFNAPQSFANVTLTGTLAGSGDVTVTGTLSWTAGTMSGSGTTIITGALSIEGTAKTLSRTLRNDGAVTWPNTANSTVTLNNGAILNNGNFDTTSNFRQTMASGGGTNLITNSVTGVLSHSSGNNEFLIINVPFNNDGQVNVNESVDLNGVGTHSGDFAIISGAALNVRGNQTFGITTEISGTGTMTQNTGTSTHNGTTNLVNQLIMSGGTLNLNGSTTLGFLQQTGGTLNLNGATQINGPADSTFSSGTLAGSGNVTFAGTLNWTGGTMSGTGKTIIATGATLNISGDSDKHLQRTIESNGTTDWTGATPGNGYVRMNNGTFTNAVGAVFNASVSGKYFNNVGGTNFFNNLGLLIASNTNQDFSPGFGGTPQGGTLTFNNTGTVSVQRRGLSLECTVAQVSSGTLTGGTWVIADHPAQASFLSGFGLGTITTIGSAASVTLEGPVSAFAAINGLTTIEGTLTLAGGRDFTANPSGGTFTNSGTLNLEAGSVVSVNGGFTQPGSTLNVDIAGPVAGTDFGQVVATGAVSVNGSLVANLIGGYDPGFAVSFPVVVGSSLSGTFSSFGGSGSTASGRLLRDRYDATTAFVSVRPLAPSAADLIASSDSGVSSTDDLTNDNTPTFDGTATDVATVNIYADGNLVGSAPVGGGGAWSATASALLDGARVITATIVDADGDESPFSSGLTITIDTLAPAIPSAPDLQAGSDSGSSSTDNYTNDTTPTFDIVSTDAFYRVERDGVQISGDYEDTASYTAPVTAQGVRGFALRAVDAAGNASAPSASLDVTIDTTAPIITNPGNQSFEIVDTAGTIVNYTLATANDNLDPSPLVQHAPASGSSFLPGTTPVDVTATDLAGNASNAAFDVTLNDSPFIVRGPGAAYAFSGTTDALMLTITAGQVTFVDDAANHKPNLNVDVEGAGTTLLMNTTQHVANFGIDTGSAASLAAGGSRVLVVTDVSVGGTGVLDLRDNSMIVDYSAADGSPLTDIKGYLTGGYNGGAWNGSGINSSTAAATAQRALGYAESSAIFSNFPAVFAGQQVDDTAVLVRYTRYGDTNLDQTVNLSDFNRLAANFGGAGTLWSDGNFNFDNTTNLSDFNLLAGNFGQSASPVGPDF